MKKNIFITAFLILFALTAAVRSYCQSGKLPPFAIMLSDGKVFRAHQLPMEKPIAIIYFSPECDHCEVMMKEFLKKEVSFRKASVVMITHLSVDKVAKFCKQYDLKKYPNLYVGTEGSTFFVRNYYKIKDLPFIALHDKMGNMVKTFRKDGALPALAAQLNNLK